MKRNCILDERRRGGCASCPATCPHYISLYGLSGTGGRVGAANLPEDYRNVTLENSPARASQPKVYGRLDQYAATFERQFDENSDRIKSLYLFSESPGTGKTTSAAALINAWLVEHYLGSLKRNRQALQQPAYFLDANEMQSEYNLATMTRNEAKLEGIGKLIEKCQRVPFLVMDDIGVRGATEAFRSYLHSIINYRCANGLPTIYTSNLPIEDMATVFDARLYDRMRDMCAELEFEGGSKRGRR